ncbi:sensor histidine kinase [Lachnospiraceae bacterium]|nr:HAMP domain-containing sensor histidine kinase [uncultured Schaedlerella sp.]NBI60127.1 sensor histidine kinase [Lachnospiraceae bacterium]
MKAFNRIFSAVTVAIILLFAVVNMILAADKTDGSRPYRVEISRLVREIETNGSADMSECVYVTTIERYGEKFYSTDSDYVIYEINGELYRFDYRTNGDSNKVFLAGIVNAVLGAMAILFIAVMLYIKFAILVPFERLSNIPYELSKGNLTTPIKETKNRFFGNFLWGIDILRENIEQQKQRELEMQKEKKTLLLSLSHDIKTPLSVIKLYSAALSRNLYSDTEKQQKIAENITEKADEIEGYVSQIITASREEFLSLEVNIGEFYLSELVEKITGYYREKLALIKTDFNVGKYKNCLLSGDLNRSVEVLQNIMENAIKYGDGRRMELIFSEADECVQIAIMNGGCTLGRDDLPHIFESFWRGANTENIRGSGLGLYICRQLMRKMNGEIFAEIADDIITVTAVFAKA